MGSKTGQTVGPGSQLSQFKDPAVKTCEDHHTTQTRSTSVLFEKIAAPQFIRIRPEHAASADGAG